MFAIDGYEGLQEIGRGGMAVVYKATQTKLSRLVALKVLPEHLAFDRQFVERFRREAAVAAQLNHPNIVTIHDIGECSGHHYIAMEFVEGRTLAQILQEDGPLDPTCACGVVRAVALALEAARTRGVVHRDIKPSNVMVVDRTGRVVLADFGIAKAGGGGTALTVTGVGLGTPTYMAPEQVDGREADHRSDLYALGILFFQAITGEVPFKADSPLIVLHHHAVTPPPPLRSKRPDAPPWLEAIIERCLAKSPEARYQTAGDLARDIQLGLSGREAEMSRPTVAPPTTPGLEATVQFQVPALEAGRRPATRFCGQCGAQTRQGYKFCQACGATAGPRAGQGPPGARQLVGAALLLALLLAVGLGGYGLMTGPPAATPTPAVASDYLNPKDGSVMVNVPAGEFFMGASPRDQDANSYGDQPGRKVNLPAYQIGKYEVTNAHYAQFVAATGHVQDQSWREYARRWGDQAPVVNVSWDDADAYCRWAGLRLPSEAEWERAARGTDGRIYPWGDTWEARRAVFDATPPRAVGSKPAGISPAGCLDMAGNVSEWTDDWYDSEQEYKVNRGGCWYEDVPGFLRCSLRGRYPRDLRDCNLGFRCARTP